MGRLSGIPRSPFPFPRYPFPAPRSTFHVPRSPFSVPRSPSPVPHSLFPVPRSLLPVACSLFPVPRSPLLFPHSPIPIPHGVSSLANVHMRCRLLTERKPEVIICKSKFEITNTLLVSVVINAHLHLLHMGRHLCSPVGTYSLVMMIVFYLCHRKKAL